MFLELETHPISWTETQSKRLSELNCCATLLSRKFESNKARDREFVKVSKDLVLVERERLEAFRSVKRRPSIVELEETLIHALIQEGFIQITTPILMAKGLLAKMGIDESHRLSSQVYWVDRKRCLRPMLAPHLYFVLKDLLRLWPKPVCLFEVGPCFRNETRGSQHASEFTMLNVVEMGLDIERRNERLIEIIHIVMRASGISEYLLDKAESEVYGETVDIIAGKKAMEVGSGAMGPHRLDHPWKINEVWVGVGFGLERLLMAEGSVNCIKKVGRSLGFLDGVRLNI